MDTPHIYIASLLPPTGETGVQTHFNTFSEFAKQSGLDGIDIVTPYAANRIIRGISHRVAKLVGRYDRELEILCRRQLLNLLLRRELLGQLRSSNSSRSIIYAQGPLCAKTALHLKHRGWPIEVVLIIHFNVSEAWEVVTRGIGREGGPLWRKLLQLEEEIIPKVDRLIFGSRLMETEVLKRIPKAVTVPRWIIPNTIRDLGDSSGCQLNGDLITIGTIEPRKNQEFLVQVLAEAHRLGHKYRMTIVGDGMHKGKLMDLVKKLQIEEFVNFTGYLPNAKNLIRSHRAYVHAALMEHLPHVLLEALASGKPVFAAPVGGIPEVFRDGVEGFYWNLNDAGKAARQIVSLLEDSLSYKTMSEAARKRYECEFKPEIVGPQLLRAVIGS